MAHHEFWADELHSWNIAKASTSFSDLIANIQYEGHPPVWYIILWFISKFTHNITCIQLPQSIIICLVVFIVLFFSPFAVSTRILISFGYFFLFEYGVLSRNYAPGILLAFCICIVLQKKFRHKLIIYYLLLFLMSNTHLLAAILAGCLHLYFVCLNSKQHQKTSAVILHIFIGAIIFLPALYFIFPPSDSGLNIHFWIDKAKLIDQLRIIYAAPLRAFIPMPAWWNYNFWNTEFLLQAQSNHAILKVINPLVLILILWLVFVVLKTNKKSLMLFITNLVLTFIVSFIFPLTDTRYAGFIFISFIAAYWLYYYEVAVSRTKKWLVNLLLIIQLTAGIFAIAKDIQLPFSNSYKVNELVKEVPADKKIVCDYWALNTLEAYTDKPFYCLEMQKEMSFIVWNKEFTERTTSNAPFYNGITNLFQKEHISEAYMISVKSLQTIMQQDPQLIKSFTVKLIDKKEGAIEKGSNLYLYQITSL